MNNLIVYVIFWLHRHGHWGGAYTKLVQLKQKMEKFGQPLNRQFIKELKRSSLVLFHKNDECISLNTARKAEIEKLVGEYINNL